VCFLGSPLALFSGAWCWDRLQRCHAFNTPLLRPPEVRFAIAQYPPTSCRPSHHLSDKPQALPLHRIAIDIFSAVKRMLHSISCAICRYLFNAGEGFQRFCVEHKVKMNRVSSCLLTRLTGDASGGLPGRLPYWPHQYCCRRCLRHRSQHSAGVSGKPAACCVFGMHGLYLWHIMLRRSHCIN